VYSSIIIIRRLKFSFYVDNWQTGFSISERKKKERKKRKKETNKQTNKQRKKERKKEEKEKDR
jgi:hypothetical protein